jgi:hypothetical protein
MNKPKILGMEVIDIIKINNSMASRTKIDTSLIP